MDIHGACKKTIGVLQSECLGLEDLNADALQELQNCVDEKSKAAEEWSRKLEEVEKNLQDVRSRCDEQLKHKQSNIDFWKNQSNHWKFSCESKEEELNTFKNKLDRFSSSFQPRRKRALLQFCCFFFEAVAILLDFYSGAILDISNTPTYMRVAAMTSSAASLVYIPIVANSIWMKENLLYMDIMEMLIYLLHIGLSLTSIYYIPNIPLSLIIVKLAATLVKNFLPLVTKVLTDEELKKEIAKMVRVGGESKPPELTSTSDSGSDSGSESDGRLREHLFSH